jgi:hypothetical protein
MLSAFQFAIGLLAPSSSWSGIVHWLPLQLIFLLMVLTMSLVGLLAIWAGLGRGHWFVRTAVVLGCISLLVTIPAYGLIVVYMLQAGLAIIVLAAWRNWRLARRSDTPANESTPHVNWRSPWQFSILDMLLLTVVAAWLCAMLMRTPAGVWATWPFLLAEGAITAGLTIIAAWAGLGGHRRWLYVPTCVTLFPAAPIATWLRLWQRAIRSPTGSQWQSCITYISRAAVIILSLAILVPVVGVYWRLAHPRAFSEPARPNPNGYDELVRVAKLIETVNKPYIDTATRVQIKTYVTQCGPVYGAIRAALDKPCQIPLRWGDKDFSHSIAEIQSLRNAASALFAQGRLAAMEGRNKDAIASYIDTIRLGRAAMRGGLMIDMLIGITFENMGSSGLAKMRSSLSAEECLALLPKLSDLLDESA